MKDSNSIIDENVFWEYAKYAMEQCVSRRFHPSAAALIKAINKPELNVDNPTVDIIDSLKEFSHDGGYMQIQRVTISFDWYGEPLDLQLKKMGYFETKPKGMIHDDEMLKGVSQNTADSISNTIGKIKKNIKK